MIMSATTTEDSFADTQVAAAKDVDKIVTTSIKKPARTNSYFIETPNGIPTCEQVLRGESILEPWRPQTFLEFLHTELNEENFFFFEEIEAYRALKGGNVKSPPPDTLLLLPKEVRADGRKYGNKLIDTFVKEDAPHQVNISADQREWLLQEAERAVETAGLDSAAFDDAQNEVRKLMQQDSWPRFIRKMLMENISAEDRSYRLKSALAQLLGVLLILGLFLGFFVPRWYFFLLALPIMPTVETFVTYKTNLCLKNASTGVRTPAGSVKNRVPIACPITKLSQKQRARRLMAMILIITPLATAVCFALTYVVEACVGRQLYG